MLGAGGTMDQLKSKLLSKLKETKFMKELREYDSLIKSIGECKSKSEEDRIILSEIETLKQRLSDPKIDKTRGREYMVRLIYCEMLGHDTSWAYVKAVQFASEPNILTKKAAYLALTQFFDQNHELVLLLVNTLLSDLKSDNFINVTTALVVCTKLIGPDLINAVYPLVVDRLKHPKEHVRKKAIMALHRFHQLDPKREVALAGLDMDKHFRTMLCDKDPSVMSAALCALHDVVKCDPLPYKNLIPSFTSILKQVSEHRLPKSYDYHRFPAPFIQIKLLKILAILGAGDRGASENMYTVVQQTLRRANSTHTIGNAIIFECVITITTIFPNPHLLSAAAEAVAAFLRSPSHNLRYVGIDALAGIVKINPQAAQEHQLAVVDCLEDPDDTLKLKTLELLYKMTKASNVEVIVERMISYLRTVTDEHIKRDITRKVSELAERYAPSPAWFIKVVSDVCELGGDHVEPGLAHSLTRLIAEQDTELHRSAVEQYSKLLDVPVGRNLPDVLLQVMVWVLGEYGTLLGTSTGRQMQPQQVMSKLVSLVSRQKCSDLVRQLLPPALAKLAVQGRTGLPPDVEEWVNKASASQVVELQQRAYELQALLTAPQQVQVAVLPHDASCEEFDEAELEQLRQLAFLSWYVDKAQESGAAPYIPPHQRQAAHAVPDRHGASGLRFQAYEQTAAPSPTAQSAASQSHQHDFLGDSLYGTSSAAAAQPAAASSGQPQLLGANKTGSRWGPAQFETSAGRAPAGSGSGAGAGADLLGGAWSGPGSGTSNNTAGQPAQAASRPQAKPSERDRLAASLFSGVGSGSGTGPAPIRAGGNKLAAAAASAPAHDLLSLDDSPPARTAPATSHAAPSAPAGFDLLMDFSSPVPQAAAAQSGQATAGGGSLGLDHLLLGDLGPVPQVAGLGGLTGVLNSTGGGLNTSSGLGSMSGLDFTSGLGFIGGLPGGPGSTTAQGPAQPGMGSAGLGYGTGMASGYAPSGGMGMPGGSQAMGASGMGVGGAPAWSLSSQGMGQKGPTQGGVGAFQGLGQPQPGVMGKAPQAAPQKAADPFADLI